MKANHQFALLAAVLAQGAFAAEPPSTGDFARMDRAWSAQLESMQVAATSPCVDRAHAVRVHRVHARQAADARKQR